jgi:hypothetical protein
VTPASRISSCESTITEIAVVLSAKAQAGGMIMSFQLGRWSLKDGLRGAAKDPTFGLTTSGNLNIGVEGAFQEEGKLRTKLGIASISSCLIFTACKQSEVTSQDAFENLIMREARSGDSSRIRDNIWRDGSSNDVIEAQCSIMIFAISSITKFTQKTYDYSDWPKNRDSLTLSGKSLEFNAVPEKIIEYRFSAENPSSASDQPAEGVLIVPIIYRNGRYWIVGYKYK